MRFGVDAAANAEGAYAGGLMCCEAGDGPVGVLRGGPWACFIGRPRRPLPAAEISADGFGPPGTGCISQLGYEYKLGSLAIFSNRLPEFTVTRDIMWTRPGRPRRKY